MRHLDLFSRTIHQDKGVESGKRRLTRCDGSERGEAATSGKHPHRDRYQRELTEARHKHHEDVKNQIELDYCPMLVVSPL